MNKSTFEELAQAFNELMEELEKTKLDSESKQAETEEACNDCDTCDEISMTPLEELISKRVTDHLTNNTFPSLEEAQTIAILDSINYRYNR